MKRNATVNDQAEPNSRKSPAQFTKVLDGRKQPIRGLWVSSTGRYYAQLSFEDSTTGEKKVRRVPLMDKESQPVSTVAQAKTELERLKTNRADDNLPILTRTPKFPDYVQQYLTFIKAGQGRKKPGTIDNEEYSLKGWVSHLGNIRIDKIRKVHINAYVTKRLNAGRSPRTANLDVVALRNVLKRAIDDEWLKVLPTANMRPEKCTTPKRELFTVADLKKLCAAAMEIKEDGEPVTKNGQQFRDFVELLAYCGAREQEAIVLRWADVDFDREQLTIGATGDTKNRTGRVVDFNPMLKAHLLDMQKRRAPDSQWLFPSPQRGSKDIHAKTFRVSLQLVRSHAATTHPELAKRAFHDLRHHFISFAVMSGIDFMTIAKWVGHRDGGILVGKVYGHLSNEHARLQAQRLNFGPTLLEAREASV